MVGPGRLDEPAVAQFVGHDLSLARVGRQASPSRTTTASATLCAILGRFFRSGEA